MSLLLFHKNIALVTLLFLTAIGLGINAASTSYNVERNTYEFINQRFNYSIALQRDRNKWLAISIKRSIHDSGQLHDSLINDIDTLKALTENAQDNIFYLLGNESPRPSISAIQNCFERYLIAVGSLVDTQPYLTNAKLDINKTLLDNNLNQTLEPNISSTKNLYSLLIYHLLSVEYQTLNILKGRTKQTGIYYVY